MSRRIPSTMAALMIAACAPDATTAPETDRAFAEHGAGSDKSVTVMSRNLYLGSGLGPVLGAPTPTALFQGASLVWATIQASSFPARAAALAAEIVAADAALVGLQEVTLYRVGAPFDPASATVVRYNYLQLLLDALASRGAQYRVVAVVENFDAELPAIDALSRAPRDIRLTDRDVILARGDVHIDDARAGRFAAQVALRVGGPGGASITIPRGWTSVVATVEGRTFRFVNVHLETEDFRLVNEAQGAELTDILAAEELPVVLVGDLNSASDGSSTGTYHSFLAAGYADAWTQSRPDSPGFTCCHAEHLDNSDATLSKRIDYVLVRDPKLGPERGPFDARWAEVIGDESDDRTPPVPGSLLRLWPSDHAGVVATLRVPNRVAF